MSHKFSTALALLAAGGLTSCGGEGQSASGATSTVAAAPTPTPSPSPSPTPSPTEAAHHAGATTGSVILAKSLLGGEPLVANFDVQTGLKPAWGTGAIPGPYDPYEGAFRFTCGGNAKLASDDPLFFAGQSGKSHLHQPWGSAAFNANSTPQTAAVVAETNCNVSANSANRSLYWMPALINDQGEAIQPDVISVYYKRKTASSPFCDPANAKFIGTCIGLPNQIRYVFGWDMHNPAKAVQGASWYCTEGDNKHYANLDDVFNSGCGAGAQIIANTVAQNCWDGKHLDVPDHRSHMAYGSYGQTGNYKCPASHPYYIPQEENKVAWTVTADMIGTHANGTKFSRIRLSSDAMLAGAKPGSTLHADYIESWVAEVKNTWLANCIDKGLSCNGGDLGNGRQLIGASQPVYGWLNPKPRVPLSSL